MTTSNRNKRGFTLIELLVVIAVIAILAAILFPVFARARENARRSTCASNLKQIGLGIMQYTQDYDETTPLDFFQVGAVGSDGASWRLTIYPYVKSSQIYMCLSNPERKNAARYDGDSSAAAVTTMKTMFPEVPKFSISYALNSYYATGSSRSPSPAIGGSDGSFHVVKMSSWQSPSTLVLGGESGNRYPYVRIDDDSTATLHYTFGHLQTTNVLFADGHVKAMKWSDTCSGPYTWRADGVACSAVLKTELSSFDTYDLLTQ